MPDVISHLYVTSDASVGKGSGLAYARGDNIGHPYAGCDGQGNLILIPDSDAVGLDERSA